MSKTKASKHEKSKILLSEIAHGAKVTFENAEQLFFEAVLLNESGSQCRALFLHQISIEECGKIQLLIGRATTMLMGEELDEKKFSAALASHKAKNSINAYMLTPEKEELTAKGDGDWKAASKAFDIQKAKFHTDSNFAKNASLYVDFRNSKFVSPEEQISTEMVTEITKRNKEFLNYSHSAVELLQKWKDDHEGVSETLIHFKKRAEQLKDELSDNPTKAMAIIFKEMLTQALAKRKI